MYELSDFGMMISDRVRMQAYQRAIAQTVGAGDVVADLGAGTGVLSLLACKAGAKHVYAVETNPLIERGPALARANGFEDRITFVRGDAAAFTPELKVDVVIGDVRGSLPVVSGLDLYRDAAQRYLAPGGRVVPQRDEIFLAPLSARDFYLAHVQQPWADNPLGLDLSPELQRVTVTAVNTMLPSGDGLLEARSWAEFDYAKGKADFAHHVLSWDVDEPTTLHFLALWFDTVLAPGIGYSNAPGADGPRVYGHILLPLVRPLDLTAGDQLNVRLRTNPDYSVWSWNTELVREGQRVDRLEQSSFGAFDVETFRRLRHAKASCLNTDGTATSAVLTALQDGLERDAIVADLTRANAGFATLAEAGRFVDELIEKFAGQTDGVVA